MKTFSPLRIRRRWLPAFGLGAVAGLLALVLWTPASGRATRRTVRQWLRTWPRPVAARRPTPPTPAPTAALAPQPAPPADLATRPDHLLANR
ncbi:YtxH domain-containing protein [Hymenobacter aquaticus]|uniref:YtxH domain-containing protein n=1 Tax=Hymenobacter aquaticus TaxID=1867101 RepID=A0A4Z0Q1F0_9BACT|nr:YtxH domain-containing protein [Hymenobacter aquaticus]TGE23878.1 YtxH domain-containing protein [Hymenobacter aquaticus]